MNQVKRPQKIYDLNNDSDDMISDFTALIARQEYKMIKKGYYKGKDRSKTRKLD